MTKFSGIPPLASPALTDYLIGVTSGNVDFRATIQVLVNLMVKTSLMTAPYKFSVYRSAAFTPGSGFQVVQHDTKDFDTGTNIDVVTNKGRFTAPVAGYYVFHGVYTASSANNGATLGTHLYKNGALVKRGSDVQFIYVPGSNGSPSATVSALLLLSAGDYVEHVVNSNALAATTGAANTSFQGYLFSAS